jgi:peptide/nickel transport system permease protein
MVGRYLMQRLIEGIITLWLITLVVFFLLRLGGSNPVEYMLPPDASRADIEKLTRAYGFDQPLLQQYWIFNRKLLRGDLGNALAWDKRPTVKATPKN